MNDGATYGQLAVDRRVATTFERPLLNFTSKKEFDALPLKLNSLKTKTSKVDERRVDKDEAMRLTKYKLSKLDTFSSVMKASREHK
jgi:hypothetical protein